MVLRDPADRALSSYNFFTGQLNPILELMGIEGVSISESFVDMAKRQITEFENLGINPDTGTLLMCLICSYACKFHSNGHHNS